jgi:hypothetical protein
MLSGLQYVTRDSTIQWLLHIPFFFVKINLGNIWLQLTSHVDTSALGSRL